MTDEQFIKRTFRLARKARGMTSPNPMVGAILVRNGRILAEDFHRRAGTPHAEVLAIAKARDKTKGSSLYVNLEPCCHTDKRTPPCTREIIRAGIRRVIVSMKDPNPKVSGKGIAELERAGIQVRSGILEDQAKRLNEAYVKYITTGMPFVTLKIAMTLDGKIATPGGESKWITGEKSRKQVHRLRSIVDAVLTAIGTVKADDPQLTARFCGDRNPVRIVIDPLLEISPDAKILRMPPQTILVTRSTGNKAEAFRKAGIDIIHFEDKLDLKRLLQKLGQRNMTSVLIEGGSSLNAHALEDGIVDKAIFFIAPKIIGGRDSYPAVGGKTFRSLNEAYQMRDVSMRRIAEDILIEGYLSPDTKSPAERNV